MRTVPKPFVFGGLVMLLYLVAASFAGPVRSAPPHDISLMQTLSEWAYPGSNLSGGATMSDGGNPLVQSVKCSAVSTTPDPVEKVAAFYAEKLKAGELSGRQAAKGEGKSVSIQDDSNGRPLALRVIVVNKADTSTTLVISRAEGEKETHIAWSHHIRLASGR